MKHIKKYNFKQTLKYKEGDIVGYDRYLNQPPTPVKILRATESSPFPYFVEEIKKQIVHTVARDELIDLTPEQKDEVELYINTQKYNV